MEQTVVDSRSESAKIAALSVRIHDKLEALAADTGLIDTDPGAPDASRAGPRSEFQHGIIARAKAEWEGAVDAVPELICLLDRRLRIVRINRTIERWGFAPLRAALGAHIHRVMHPRCPGRRCALARGLKDLSSQLEPQGSATAHIEDSVLARVLSLDMRTVDMDGPGGERTRRYTLLVIGDVTELTQTQQTLNQLNEQLEQRVLDRTRELERANEFLRSEIGRREAAESALCRSRNELSQLSVQLMRAQEGERKHLAQELHDSVGQSLSAVKYTLEHAIQLLRNEHGEGCASRLNLAVQQVQRLIGEVRSISSGLRPTVLDDLGVASALSGFCREWAQVYRDVELLPRIDIQDADVPDSLRTAVFRTVQEALNNAAKHSAASRVWVTIRRDQDTLTVEVADDGRGFALASGAGTPEGLGLRGMRERADHTGGRLQLEAAPGRGTRLRITWLLPGPAARPEALA